MENKKPKTEKKTQKLLEVIDEFEIQSLKITRKTIHHDIIFLLMRLIVLDYENKETKKVKKSKNLKTIKHGGK